jgi:hypothetical protein
MLKRIADNRDPGSLAVKYRRKRFAFFQSLLSQVQPPIHILDIGGTEVYWQTMGLEGNHQVSITLLNLTKQDLTLPNVTSVVGDARNLKFGDNHFDVVFSNSVIEHVGDYADQTKMANEVRRVGKRYFVQTPNKSFPLEPHFLFPFFQFLPVPLRITLLRNFNMGWFPRTSDPVRAREIVEEIRLLSKSEFLKLFPRARLYEEKVFAMTKSFAAYEGWDLNA